MSWLARSLSTSLRFDHDDQNDVAPDPPSTSPQNHQHQQPQQQHQHHHQYVPESHEPEESQEPEELEENEFEGRGVKDDLDDIKQTFTRQLWGVASFLAPPPPPTNDSGEYDPHVYSPEHRLNRSDPDCNQSEPSNPSSGSGNEEHHQDGVVLAIHDPDLVPNGSGSEPEVEEWDFLNAVGITEEVFSFATNIAMHPETWLDFPIEEEEDTDDFEISEAQLEHAYAIERLAPRLAALRIELCPCHMSEGYFWKVYFVLLHSRLNKSDAEILSTPQVIAARAMWMKELHKQTKPDFECFGRSTSFPRDTAHHDICAPSLLGDAYAGDRPHGYEMSTHSTTTDYKTEEHTVESSEAHFIGKSVIEQKTMIKTEDKDQRFGRASQIILQDCEEDDDDWPEDDSDLGGYGGTTISMVNEEEISFSDLDNDDYDINPVKCNQNPKVA